MMDLLQSFSCILQIKPLVEPTRIIVNLPSLEYAWHDLVSKSEFLNVHLLCVILFMVNNTGMLDIGSQSKVSFMFSG